MLKGENIKKKEIFTKENPVVIHLKYKKEVNDEKEISIPHIVNPRKNIKSKMMFGTHIYKLEWTNEYS